MTGPQPGILLWAASQARTVFDSNQPEKLSRSFLDKTGKNRTLLATVGTKTCLPAENPEAAIMKTLHRYLLREVLATLFMTVLVATFLLLLGNLFKEILMLLVNRQITFFAVVQALGMLVPFVLAFALPIGMLTATLLVFGRFSADQELTAARASGISLLSLAMPIIGLSLLLCGVAAALNMQLAPQGRVSYKRLLFELGVKQPDLLLPEGQYVTDFKDCVFWVGKNNRNQLKDVLVYLTREQTNTLMTIHAPRGQFRIDEAADEVEITLFEARSSTMVDGRWLTQYLGEWSYKPDMRKLGEAAKRTSLNNMTFSQLWQEMEAVNQRIAGTNHSAEASVVTTARSSQRLKRTVADLTLPIRFQLNRQVAFSFACFGFTLVGIPLAIRMHRRETNIGIVIALVLVVIYYVFVILAQALSSDPRFWPHVIVWIPNFVFQAVGGYLLWRLNKGI